MVLSLTPAHVNDGDMASALMKQVASRIEVKFFILDAGYDQLENYETAWNLKARAIIPMNLRNEKESPAGMTSSGSPCCSTSYAMTYWGVDGGIFILQLWNGGQSGYEKRFTPLLQSASGIEALEGILQ